jgi:glycosyltransferase involved in cell wall biosynthesis
MTHVFVLPSWYPEPHSKDIAYGGKHFEDLIHGLANKFQQLYFSIGHIDHSRFALSLKNPIKALSQIWHYIHTKSLVFEEHPRVIQYYRPILQLPQKLFPGYNAVVSVSRKNFNSATKKWGKPVLIHAFVGYPGGFAAMKLAQEFNIPFILTEVMGPFPFDYLRAPNNTLSPILSDPLLKANRVIAISNAYAAEVKKYINREIDVIPMLLEENVFYPDYSFQTQSIFRFFSCGRLTEMKGVFELLDAAEIVVHQYKLSDFIIEIVGDADSPADFENIINKVRKKNIQNQIQFSPKLERKFLPAKYQRADCFILASRFESLGVVYLEALACGKPIIATACLGPNDMVTPENGLLVPVNDPQALAQAMAKMIRRERKYDPKIIRSDFERRYGSEQIIQKYAAIYQSVSKVNFM